jgi:hypothetical protein
MRSNFLTTANKMAIGINHISASEKLVQQYEETIQSLKEQIALLKLLMDK